MVAVYVASTSGSEEVGRPGVVYSWGISGARADASFPEEKGVACGVEDVRRVASELDEGEVVPLHPLAVGAPTCLSQTDVRIVRRQQKSTTTTPHGPKF